MITVKTTNELLALRNDQSIIRVDDSLCIECDVPWSVGNYITAISTTGDLYCSGTLDCGDYLRCRGDLYCSGNLYCNGNLDCDSNLKCSSNMYCNGYVNCRGNMYCDGNLESSGDLICSGDYLIITGDLFWTKMHKPQIPERTYIGRVLPLPYQRNYWAERLGMEFEDCYKEIDNILRDEKWTPTERWMLETLKARDQPIPYWVEKIQDEISKTNRRKHQ